MKSPEIVYEDNHLIIIRKYPGELVQGDKTGDISLLEKTKKYLKVKYEKPGNVYLGTVHRLDRPTGGLLIFAKTSKALGRLNTMLRERQIRKTYLAIIPSGELPASGTLINHLKKNEAQNKSFVVKPEVKGAKKAVLHYQILTESQRYSLLEIQLETGRHHQIRCQLAATGHPIAGDVKYGFKRPFPDKSIALWAYKLSFIHPVSKKKMDFTTRVPESGLWKLFDYPGTS